MAQHIIVLILFFTVIVYHGYKFLKKKKEGEASEKCSKCPSAGKMSVIKKE